MSKRVLLGMSGGCYECRRLCLRTISVYKAVIEECIKIIEEIKL